MRILFYPHIYFFYRGKICLEKQYLFAYVPEYSGHFGAQNWPLGSTYFRMRSPIFFGHINIIKTGGRAVYVWFTWKFPFSICDKIE